MVDISVIIPVYNAENHIKNTVDLINQSSCVPSQIILINDGSKDNSLNICNELSNRYSNVLVVNQQNKGVAETRNTGLNVAKGDYICFVDQDDIVDLNMYEKVQNIIECDNPDVVMVSTGQQIDGNKIPMEILPDGCYKREQICNELIPAFLFRGYVLPSRNNNIKITSSIWKRVIKKSLIEQNDIKFRRIVNYEDDFIMIATLLCAANSVSTTSYIGYYWLYNRISESHRPNYINEFVEKTVKLADYMSKDLFVKYKISEDTVDLFYQQFVFERIIEVILNSYSSVNPQKAGNVRKKEVMDYMKKTNYWNLSKQKIQPLKHYHRIRVLYFLWSTKNTFLLINGMRLFLRIEQFIHNSNKIMSALNKKK